MKDLVVLGMKISLLVLILSNNSIEGAVSVLDKVFSYSRLRDKPTATLRLDALFRNASETEKKTKDAPDKIPAMTGGNTGFTQRMPAFVPSSLYIYEHRIPRIIHQMWKTKKVHRVFSEYIKSWIRLHPFWEYRFWTDKSGEGFIKNVYPWFWDTFQDFSGIQRSDALRYFILHQYGGVYADLDVEAVVPLDLILNQTLTLSQEPLAHAVILENRDRQVCNAFMASPPSHPFWPFVHAYMRDHQVRNDPVGSTGPRMLDSALDAYRDPNISKKIGWEDVNIGAPEVFMPLFDDKLNDFERKCLRSYSLSSRQKRYCKVMAARNYENRIEANSLTVHHWSHTWLGHVKSEDFVDVWELVNITRSRFLANTHFSLVDEVKQQDL